MTGPPPEEVLEAFGATAAPEPLPGGQGQTWRAGEVVLKPVDDVVVHAWVCDVFDGWTSAEVAVPQPLRADGRWAAHGWGAHVMVPGTSTRAGDDPAWFRGVHEAFHAALADLAPPAFLDTRDDAWSVGDRVAWEGLAPTGSTETCGLVERALAHLTPVDLPSQVIHGDLGGNVLRDGDRAAVIDWPPYRRPVGFALAVVAMDAVCWEDADPALLDTWSDQPAWDQLLLRAVVYRLATRGCNQARGVIPAGSEGYASGEGYGLRLLEARLA